MAEIEHFVDPLDKSHEKFASIKHVKLALLPKAIQMEGKSEPIIMSIEDAVNQVLSPNY